VDSGSNCTIVGGKGADLIHFRAGGKTFPSRLKTIRTADGKQHPVTKAIELEAVLDSSRRRIRVYYVPDLQHSVILGCDFCRLFGLKIDFAGHKIEVASDIVRVPECDAVTECGADRHEITEIIRKNLDLLSNDGKLGRTHKMTVTIDTGEALPIKQRPYWWSPYMLAEVNKEIDRMLENNVISPSDSPWSSPILLVKKSSGEYRLCFDGRRLNAVTKRDSYPLPRVDRILSMLRGAKYISSIDLKNAFWQIPLDSESRPKTAFAIPGRGLFHFNVLPFGLTNAAQRQQCLMDRIFGPELEPHVFVYLDDLIIIAPTFEKHVQVLREVIRRLRDAKLTVNAKKCQLFRSSLKYLGFIVDEHGLGTDPDKVAAMVSYPVPKTSTEIKRFVGMCSWYRRFIPHFSTLMSPINALLTGKRKRQKTEWTPEAQEAFQKIKDALVSAPVLSSPDFSKPFVIQTDASNTGLGAVLTQDLDGDERVIAYASRSLTKAERNYSVTERECLAVLFALEKFRPYVEGTHFTIVTDHYSLLWLNRMKDPAGKLARWSVKLNQFSFDLVHRKGKLNVVPDALSRLPAEIAAVDIDSFLGVNLNDLDESYTRLRDNIIANPQRNPSWKVENGFVYRFVPNKIVLPGNVPEWKLLVPRNQRTKILESCHDAPTSAHFGYYKTLSRLSINHFWPKMRRSVIRYVRNCKVCNEQKAPNTARAGLMGKEKKVQFPWQMISVDLIGPLPTSTKGYSYLLVIVDWFTKYVVLFPLRKATSSKVTECIENGIFLVYGVPQFILVDNGKQFVGNEFVKTCENYKVQKIWFTAKYHPQSNPVERYNRTVGTAIRSYVKGAHKKWDAEVARIGYAIRTAVNEVTGFSPAFLNFGRVVPCTGEFYGKVAENPETLTTADREDHAKNLEHLKTILQDVTQHLHKAHERNERSYNLRKRDAEFFVGDKVWKRNKVLSSAAKDFAQKLAPRYVLCTITRKLSKLAYALEDENRADLGVWHMKDLKEFRGSLAEAEEP
jgi:hypothetical protein